MSKCHYCGAEMKVCASALVWLECPDCKARGPWGFTSASAIENHDALNLSPTKPTPPATSEFDALADKLGRFQKLLRAAGNAPNIEGTVLLDLFRLMVGTDVGADLTVHAVNDLRTYLGLGPTDSPTPKED